MKFSENWLRQHVTTDATRDELAATLTAIGLEVEELVPLGEELDGVVVARIVSAAKHPEADRLQVCQVDAGNGTMLQMVCGPPNPQIVQTACRDRVRQCVYTQEGSRTLK